MTVAIFSQNKFSSIDDMRRLMSNDEISRQVQHQKANYYQIDASKTMADLTQVGQLLKLAYAGTKKMTSAGFTIKMLCHYQRFVKDSMVTTGSFVAGSVKVLKWHKMSLSLTEKEKYAVALKFLAKASTIAAEMSQISEERVKQAEELLNLAEQASGAVTKDENMEAFVAALSVAWETLDRVGYAFEYVRKVWEGVERRTQALCGVSENAEALAELAETDVKEDLIGTIYDSAIGWLTIALISQDALEAIEPANKRIDAVMNDLPNDAEAALLLKTRVV